MILTYKIKHNRDFSDELLKARRIAEYVVAPKPSSAKLTSRDVKHLGLKSVISNQIIRKYGRNKKIKKVNRVNLIIPNQGIQIKEDNIIYISSLKLNLKYQFPAKFEKINQIEINREYAFVSVTVAENTEYEPEHWLGVDRNTTGHVVVAGEPDSGKVMKLGKHAQHTHNKYKNIRKRLQKLGKYKKVKRIKNRESRIVRDLNHKMSRKIVDTAKSNNSGIKLEKLKGIRKNRKHAKSFKYSLNSWTFYQLQTMIEYKAKLLGVPVSYIDPAYTSQKCSRCGHIGDRNGKNFECPACGHVDHADVNAAFNIALSPCMSQSSAESDVLEGSTGAPEVAMT
jgi:putative transposase